MKRTKEQDRHHKEGFNAGIAVAAAICVSAHGEDTMAEEILLANNMDSSAKAKRMGADAYDLDILKPVFAHIRAKRS